ncbi:unnamed protein product, partial [Ectocarpus sp. 12 AP-2014]
STATASKGDFDPLVETVRAARSCSAIITNLLTLPRSPPPPPAGPAGSGGGSAAAAATAAVQECLTLSARAGMAMTMVSSTAFGEAVREALVRSPSRELRENAMGVMAALAGIDREVAGEAGAYEGGDGGGGGGEFVSQTTVMAQLLISLVPYGGNEPDGAKCRELYRLLSEFLSKGNVDARALCATLPALRPPPPAAPPAAAGSGSPSPHATGENAANNGGSGGSGGGNDGGGGGGGHVDTSFYSIDGPLPAPASADEREFDSKAVAALSEAVAADGVPALAQVVPLLVWLMRLIVKPRATAADAHLSGLLGLARIVIGWLGPRGKEAVGLRGLEGICAAEEGVVGTRGRGLLHHVYHECLFDIATHDNHGPLAPPKCRSEGCRANAFGLLTDLATDCRANVAVLIDLLLRHHSSSSPCRSPSAAVAAAATVKPPKPTRSASSPDSKGNGGGRGGAGCVERVSWAYAPRQTDKAECGYVGLQNLGATCYMNSLLQQLFMVPALRFGVMSCDPFVRTPEQIEKGEGVVPREENLLYQLQDVDEFLLVFLDRLETQLSGLPQRRLLQHVFGGQLCNQLIGAEAVCPHVSERQEDFFVLGLDVKGKRSITESLQLYVEGEVLAGDNKFLCAQCNEKRDTLKRTCIARLPNVLFLHLKRFEFDMMEMRKVKVNDKCEFPMELDMRPYTKEGLARQPQQQQQQQEGKGESAATGTAKAGGSPREDEGEAFPDSYYEYKLAGVLVHMGTADSGHYYSYIKRRDTQGGGDIPASWFCFNDASVTPFDPDSLGMTCHGGYSISPTGRGHTPKQFSAYMLIYEREFILPNPAPPAAPSPTGAAAAVAPHDGDGETSFGTVSGGGVAASPGGTPSRAAAAAAPAAPAAAAPSSDGAVKAAAVAVVADSSAAAGNKGEAVRTTPYHGGTPAENGKPTGVEDMEVEADEEAAGGGGGGGSKGDAEKTATRELVAGGKGEAVSPGGAGDEWEPPWMGVPRPSELVPPSIFKACWMENRLFLMDKNVFSSEYLDWVCDLTALVPPPRVRPSGSGSGSGSAEGARIAAGGDDVDEVELSTAKVAMFLALDTVARAKNKERLSQLMGYAKRWFRASPTVCRWALEQASCCWL